MVLIAARKTTEAGADPGCNWCNCSACSHDFGWGMVNQRISLGALPLRCFPIGDWSQDALIVDWVKIPVGISLGVVGVILVVAVIASLLTKPKEAT